MALVVDKARERFPAMTSINTYKRREGDIRGPPAILASFPPKETTEWKCL